MSSSSWYSNAFSFIGNAGCVYLRIKTVFAVLVIVPFFSLLLYFLLSTKTEEAYTVIGTVESTNSFNAAKVSYTDPTTNTLVTSNVNTTNMNQAMIVIGNPLTVYIDKKNPSNVHAQQPFTKTVKYLIIGLLLFILSLLMFEIFVSFFNNQLCQVLGGTELVADTFHTAENTIF